MPICDEYRAMFSGCDKFSQLFRYTTRLFHIGVRRIQIWLKQRILDLSVHQHVDEYLESMELTAEEARSSAQTPSFPELLQHLAVDIVDELCV